MTNLVIMKSAMRSIPISELKARLSEHLRLVKAGEPIIVTQRGKPIAVLRPVRSEEAELQDLIEAGLVRPGRGQLPEDFWESPRASDPDGKVLQALLDERRESW